MTFRRYLPQPAILLQVSVHLAPIVLWTVLVAACVGLYATFAEVSRRGLAACHEDGDGMPAVPACRYACCTASCSAELCLHAWKACCRACSASLKCVVLNNVCMARSRQPPSNVAALLFRCHCRSRRVRPASPDIPLN